MYGPRTTVQHSEKPTLNTSASSENLQIIRVGFSEFLSSHAALNVGKVLFPLFALALGLPETYFDDKVGLGSFK